MFAHLIVFMLLSAAVVLCWIHAGDDQHVTKRSTLPNHVASSLNVKIHSLFFRPRLLPPFIFLEISGISRNTVVLHVLSYWITTSQYDMMDLDGKCAKCHLLLT